MSHPETGVVFDIQRFCTHDGPGIRTVVFLKGCPLHCPWCHNPESQSREPELRYTPSLCTLCGRCVSQCDHRAHSITGAGHALDRSRCVACLGCAAACPGGALEVIGREMAADEVVRLLERDRVFYEESGGGITLSGGEPMAQAPFARAILSVCREAGLHTCMETCGAAPQEFWPHLVPLVDLFLWDLKHTDAAEHRRLTGSPLSFVLDNLSRVDASGAATRLRCLLLDGLNFNEEHLDGLARVSRSLTHCQGVDLLAFHPLGAAKRAGLGLPTDCRPEWTPRPEAVQAAANYLRERWSIDAQVC